MLVCTPRHMAQGEELPQFLSGTLTYYLSDHEEEADHTGDAEFPLSLQLLTALAGRTGPQVAVRGQAVLHLQVHRHLCRPLLWGDSRKGVLGRACKQTERTAEHESNHLVESAPGRVNEPIPLPVSSLSPNGQADSHPR